jgi:lysyl-tRNA synthetase class 1
LTYGPEESLAFYAYREPKKAKQLHMGVIPRAVDEYWQFRGNYAGQPIEQRLGNPVHHIHNGDVPEGTLPVSFGLLLNLCGVLGAEASSYQILKYLRKLFKISDQLNAATPSDLELAKEWEALPAGNDLARLVRHALAYHRDFVAPTLKRRVPTPNEAAALKDLDTRLAAMPADASAEDIQNEVYAIGKEEAYGFETLRDWFKALYETLLGAEQGPRMGSFIALYGIENSRKLIAEALA